MYTKWEACAASDEKVHVTTEAELEQLPAAEETLENVSAGKARTATIVKSEALWGPLLKIVTVYV